MVIVLYQHPPVEGLEGRSDSRSILLPFHVSRRLGSKRLESICVVGLRLVISFCRLFPVMAPVMVTSLRAWVFLAMDDILYLVFDLLAQLFQKIHVG